MRGVGLARAHKYGMDFENYIQTANRDTAVILQAENRQAVNQIESIVSTPGVDAILIGPYDLSASLGKIGQVTDQTVKNAIERITDACLAANTKLGIFGVSQEAVEPYLDKGFSLITVGVDALFVVKSASETLNGVREEITRKQNR